jgi:TolB protein
MFERRLLPGLLFALALLPAAMPAAGYDDINPAWSPDGRYIVFSSDRDGVPQLWVYDVEAATTRQLTTFQARKSYSANWAADSASVVFHSGRGGKFEAFRLALAGEGETEAEELTRLRGYLSSPSLSPDGSRIAFSADVDDPNAHEIYVLELATGELTRLTDDPASDWSPVWSPDGERLAFVSDRRVRFDFDIYVMAADGSEPTMQPDSFVHEYSPEWSPDGTRLLFFGGDQPKDFELYELTLATGEVKALTQGAGAGRGDWSPDGSRIVFSAPSEGGKRLFTMPAEGGAADLLPGME